MWKGCTILVCTPVLLLAVSWCVLDWTDAGADAYPGGTVLRDAAGRILRVTLGPGDVDCRPSYVADPDDWIVKALVASEDGAFWTHRGVRPLSALRAAFQNVFYRRRISGASTLSMQTVRLIAPHPKTYWWKFREAILALKMERQKDKVWILSQYLNRAPFGSNFVGIEAAANGWFGKGAKELGLGEAALLAGMVQAPSRFRPDRGYERAIRRRDYVLGRMRELGYVTDEQLAAARSVRPEVRPRPRPYRVPHFCDWYLAARAARGEPACADVTTALDADLQVRVENALAGAVRQRGHSAAAVVLSARTGDVLAMAVDTAASDRDGACVNTAVLPRPAGSTLKPFLAARALDCGRLAPEEVLLDAPYVCRGYRPVNFDGTYRGPVPLGDALVLSLNVPFVRLLEELGVGDFVRTLRRLGLPLPDDAGERFGLGLAIGNAEVSLLDLAQAYRALATPSVGVFSSEAAFVVTDLLSGDARAGAALGHVAAVACPRFAWKTGTSSAYRDAWTVAWNPEYVIAVWCGHLKTFGDATVVGASAAAPVAWSIARGLYPQNDGPWYEAPEGLVARTLCTETGRPANAACPRTREGRVLAARAALRPCVRHRFGADGRPTDAVARQTAFAIRRPEDGAVIRLVPGFPQQKVVCEVVGIPAGTRLWWFADGVPVAETARPLQVFDLDEGVHALGCKTEDGAEVRVSVTVEGK